MRRKERYGQKNEKFLLKQFGIGKSGFGYCNISSLYCSAYIINTEYCEHLFYQKNEK